MCYWCVALVLSQLTRATAGTQSHASGQLEPILLVPSRAKQNPQVEHLSAPPKCGQGEGRLGGPGQEEDPGTPRVARPEGARAGPRRGVRQGREGEAGGRAPGSPAGVCPSRKGLRGSRALVDLWGRLQLVRTSEAEAESWPTWGARSCRASALRCSRSPRSPQSPWKPRPSSTPLWGSELPGPAAPRYVRDEGWFRREPPVRLSRVMVPCITNNPVRSLRYFHPYSPSLGLSGPPHPGSG